MDIKGSKVIGENMEQFKEYLTSLLMTIRSFLCRLRSYNKVAKFQDIIFLKFYGYDVLKFAYFAVEPQLAKEISYSHKR